MLPLQFVPLPPPILFLTFPLLSRFSLDHCAVWAAPGWPQAKDLHAAEKVARAGELRNDGNGWFEKGDVWRAGRRYGAALNLISLDQVKAASGWMFKIFFLSLGTKVRFRRGKRQGNGS